MKRYQVLIDGVWRDPGSGLWFESFDPTDGQPWAQIPRCDPADVDAAVAAARRAFEHGPWARMRPTERGALLRRFADLALGEAERLAAVETRDNGKLLAEMRTQTAYAPQWFHYFGGLADKIEGAVPPIDKPEMFNFTRYEPLGVVAAITAWNSPLLLAAYKLAPALAAGNTVVLKPSEHASASTLEFARLVALAGFPPGVVNVVTGFGSEIGDALTGHPDVAKIAFTGSEATGRRINEIAAASFKKVTLELGGKSANIVFDDADLDNAANGAIAGIFAASGQTCVAGSRLLVHKRVYAPLMERLLAGVRDIRTGDPRDPATHVGPVASRAQYEKVAGFIADTQADGARLAAGGRHGEAAGFAQGWFVEPTVFENVTPDMRIARDEVFGPVLAVMPFGDEDEAVALANATRFGLAAGVWSKDYRRALRVAERLKAGTVWINTYRAVSFMSPFGGYKASGVGRENGADAIYEYLQVKSVWLNLAETFSNPFTIR